MMRRVRMVMLPLVLVLVACFGFARPALADWNDGGAWNVDDADMGIKWGPTSVGGDRKGFVMVSDNRFNACLMVCGISLGDERLTADAKAKLSNSDTGGGFYLLAQRFGQYGSEGNLPDWAKPSGVVVPGVGVGIDNGSLTANSAIRTCAAMYGADATWWGDYTDLELTNALKDLLAVLNGEDSGGGPGSAIAATFDVVLKTDFHASGSIKYSGTYNGPKDYKQWIWSFNVQENVMQAISQYLSDYPYAFAAAYDNRGYFNQGQSMGMSIILSKTEPTFKTTSTYKAMTVPNGSLTWSVSFPCDAFITATFTNANHSVISLNSFNERIQWWYKPLNFGSAEPVIPPTQWPDSPTYEPPTAPVVPDPVEPTIPSEPSAPTPVEPVQPDPSAPAQNPVFNDQPTYTDDTFTADLQGILDALNEHCLHLQNALYANISDLYNKLSSKLTNDLTNLKSFFHSEFGWLNDARHDDAVTTWDYLQDLFSWLGGLISDNFYSLNQHLTQLFNWLAEQFDFSFTGTGYNDDTVVSWLQKIYSKLGTGMNTRPSDPVAEPDSFGDWLTRLLQNFIGDLLSVGQEAVGGLVNDFQQLATKFPFCVPWDIAALLALFVAEPVAPVFDLPAYTITQDGLSQVSTYHISLADYNVAWEAVRFAEKIGFAVFLAWNTTHFREFLSGRGES